MFGARQGRHFGDHPGQVALGKMALSRVAGRR